MLTWQSQPIFGLVIVNNNNNNKDLLKLPHLYCEIVIKYKYSI
jgi:hypothetical protein